MEKYIQKIEKDNIVYAIVLRDEYEGDHINFFTEDSMSFQVGYLPHLKGKIIEPHLHLENNRSINDTSEVLLVKKGKVKVNFYDNDKKHRDSTILFKGDIILLCGGGHGFEILENAVMIEIKQGPYNAISDKVRFKGIEK